MKKKCPEEKGGVPEWMATYGDLVTLLMCFFVLLFAFSNIDAQKFTAVMMSFQGSAGILTGGTAFSEAPLLFEGMPEDQTSNMEVVNQEQLDQEKKKEELQENIEKLESEIAEAMDSQLVDLDVELIKTPTSIVLRFKDEMLFEPYSAELRQEAMEELSRLAAVIMADGMVYDQVLIEGHTDSTPVVSGKYEDNWQLSSARAVSVAKTFIEDMNLDPYKIVVSGYGEFKPIATNSTDIGRAMNRRVDIIIKAGEIE